MIIIQPENPTTEFLNMISMTLVENGASIYRDIYDPMEIAAILKNNPDESLMWLGHGTTQGLISPAPGGYEFDGYCIDKSIAEELRRHNVIGISCYASEFAKANGLHGLFTGMYISESDEALQYQIDTTDEEIQHENKLFCYRMIKLLKFASMHELDKFPDALYEMAQRSGLTPLTKFNYEQIISL